MQNYNQIKKLKQIKLRKIYKLQLQKKREIVKLFTQAFNSIYFYGGSKSECKSLRHSQNYVSNFSNYTENLFSSYI